LARVMERQDVRMREPRRRLDLEQEAFGADTRGELLAQDLDRDGAVVFEIVREVPGGHAAGPELAIDAVAVGEGSCETCQQRHRDFISFSPAAHSAFAAVQLFCCYT